jgi:hypothetical protein
MRWFPVALAVLAPAACWAVLVVAVPPARQDFPLNDDWAFARGATRFAAGEGAHYLNWASMPQLGQWLWAWPFLRLLHPTHFALRASTVVLSWLAVGAFYYLLRTERVGPAPAALASTALALNPLFFLLQGTFMTDGPALSLALISLALYVRAFSSEHPAWALAAAAVAVAAVTTRQNTATVLLVAAMMLWRMPQLRTRTLWLLAVLVPAIIGVATHRWFLGRSDVVPLRRSFAQPYVALLLPFVIVHFSGLATLPVLSLDGRPRPWRTFAGFLAILLACALYWIDQGPRPRYGGTLPYLRYGGLFPYLHNMITPWGAFSGLPSQPLIVGERPLILDVDTRLVLTVLGCAAGALWLTRVADRARPGTKAGPLLLFTAWQLPFMLATPEIHDRYLLVLLPGALLAASPTRPGTRGQWLASLTMLLIMGAASVALMHDWLSWNSARWALGNRALLKGIRAEQIEGGLEWDGWHTPVPRDRVPVPPRGLALPSIHASFPRVTGAYALAFSQPPHSTIVDYEPYRLWLRPGERRFLLVRYEPPD